MPTKKTIGNSSPLLRASSCCTPFCQSWWLRPTCSRLELRQHFSKKSGIVSNFLRHVIILRCSLTDWHPQVVVGQIFSVYFVTSSIAVKASTGESLLRASATWSDCHLEKQRIFAYQFWIRSKLTMSLELVRKPKITKDILDFFAVVEFCTPTTW